MTEERIMESKKIKKIVVNAVETTRWRWEQFALNWDVIDKIFINRGYEQQGFETWEFTELLDYHDIFSIKSIGKILDNYDGYQKYNRDFAGNLKNSFYYEMKNGKYGQEGLKFYKSIKEFKGNPGRSFYRLLWWMMVCCNYLKNNYRGSFAYYLKEKYSEYKGLPQISDKNFSKINSEDWEKFKKVKKPWAELYGIGKNVFDFIMGDFVDLRFVENSYKLDSANIRFLKSTGIYEGKIEHDEVIRFFENLNLPYTLREINKGIYTYCSNTEAKITGKFGFCKNKEKCIACKVNDICEKNLKTKIND